MFSSPEAARIEPCRATDMRYRREVFNIGFTGQMPFWHRARQMLPLLGIPCTVFLVIPVSFSRYRAVISRERRLEYAAIANACALAGRLNEKGRAEPGLPKERMFLSRRPSRGVVQLDIFLRCRFEAGQALVEDLHHIDVAVINQRAVLQRTVDDLVVETFSFLGIRLCPRAIGEGVH